MLPRRPAPGTKRSRRLAAPARSAGVDLPWVKPEWLPVAEPNPDVVTALTRELRLPRALCALLAVRGHSDPESAKSFLRPALADLCSPHTLIDGDRAAERIGRAIDDGETVFVHGDYDVDGVSGVTILTRWIRELGGAVVPFVPHRRKDGYDLGPSGIAAASESGATLLVTTDCGIRAHRAVADAAERGIDVIVTDHHAPGSELPPALAIVNPSRPDCPYPNKGLCGAGVAFQLCRLLGEARGRDEAELHAYLDLVALATVADLVPLTGENRILVRFGLRAMARTSHVGLEALIDVADLGGRAIDAGQVGFRIGPRINAVGRMEDAKTAVELLLTESGERASELAAELDATNTRRREEERRTLAAALEQLGEAYDGERDFGVVLDGDGWHSGVIGIVASRVVERIHRPTILLSRDGALARGSARSIPGFDLLEAVEACAGLLDRFGGHRMAAGMDVASDRIEALRSAFNTQVRATMDGVPPRPSLRADLEISLAEATHELAHYLQYVGPFGIGNPTPVFVARGVHLAEPARTVGSGHLKLKLRQGGTTLDAVGFGLAERIPPGSLGTGALEVAFKLKLNEYRGRTRVEAHLRDLRRADEAA